MVAINQNNYSEDRIKIFGFGYLSTAIASFNTTGIEHILKIFNEGDPVLRDKILHDPKTITFEEACEIAFNFKMTGLKLYEKSIEDCSTYNIDMKFSVERATVIRIADRMHHTKDGDPLLCDLKSIIVNALPESIEGAIQNPEFLFTDDKYEFCLDHGLTYNEIFEIQVDNAK